MKSKGETQGQHGAFGDARDDDDDDDEYDGEYDPLMDLLRRLWMSMQETGGVQLRCTLLSFEEILRL